MEDNGVTERVVEKVEERRRKDTIPFPLHPQLSAQQHHR